MSLDSVVIAFLDGKSADDIAGDFPALSVQQVRGAIEFYLQHRAEIDEYLVQQNERWREFAAESEFQNGSLLDRLRKHRSSNVEK